jgi:hypothetical protein
MGFQMILTILVPGLLMGGGTPAPVITGPIIVDVAAFANIVDNAYFNNIVDGSN